MAFQLSRTRLQNTPYNTPYVTYRTGLVPLSHIMVCIVSDVANHLVCRHHKALDSTDGLPCTLSTKADHPSATLPAVHWLAQLLPACVPARPPATRAAGTCAAHASCGPPHVPAQCAAASHTQLLLHTRHASWHGQHVWLPQHLSSST